MRKHIEHLMWKHKGLVGNLLAGLLFIAFVALCFGAAVFGFWLKIKMATFLFGPF